MTGQFQRKYSDTQRAAVIAEREATGDSYKKIAARLAAGQITYEGEPVPAVDMPHYYVGELWRAHVKRLRGVQLAGLGKKDHHDAIEAIRQRLLAVTELELKKLETVAAREHGKGVIDPKRIQDLARAAREIAHLDPEKVGNRVPQPGARKGTGTTSGQGNGTTPTTGLAGEIMRDHRESAARAHEVDE